MRGGEFPAGTGSYPYSGYLRQLQGPGEALGRSFRTCPDGPIPLGLFVVNMLPIGLGLGLGIGIGATALA